MRVFNWVCNAITFVCTCCIILFEAFAAYFFSAFIIAAVIQIFGNGVSSLYWKGYYRGFDVLDVLHTGEYGQRVRTWWKTLLPFGRKPGKVQPVVGWESDAVASASAESSKDLDDYSDSDDSNMSSNSDHQKHTSTVQKVTPASSLAGDHFDSDNDPLGEEDLDDAYLPHIDGEVDPFLLEQVKRLLKQRGRKPLRKISIEMSKVACRGRISGKACGKVVAKYAHEVTGLRLRATEISEELDRACKLADRRRVKEALVKDISYGAQFIYEGKAGERDRDGWSGLDAYRHIFEQEVWEPKGTFEAILHSFLSVNVREPE